MKNVKVSVVVPVYNAGEFLEKNLGVLIAQTLDEIEFVCVNDASTDNSLNILKAFKEVFPDKFTVVDSQRNRGPGGARNLGLKYARGEYIGFMDQDDYVNSDMFKVMYDKAVSDDCDMAICGHYDKEGDCAYCKPEFSGVPDDELRYEYMSPNVVWNKIFSKKLIASMSTYFRENSIDDDTDFSMEAVCRAERIAYVNEVYYYYNFYGKSTSRTGEKFNFDKVCSDCDALYGSIAKRGESVTYKDVYFRFADFLIDTQLKRFLSAMLKRSDIGEREYAEFDVLADNYSESYRSIKCKNNGDRNAAFLDFCRD